MMRQSAKWLKIVIALGAGITMGSVLHAQTLTWLGVLSTHSNASEATAVSADGSVVVGRSFDASNRDRSFRWTAQTGIQDLGTLGGSQSAAYDLSADGSVIVGWAHTTQNRVHAFRWENGVMQSLGTFSDGIRSAAYGVSADGSVVVGWARRSNNTRDRAFRWTASTGLVDIGTLGGQSAGADDVSADGSVVVGWASAGASNPHVAFRWSDGVMQSLGVLHEDGLSGAFGVSPNGTVVVGWADNESGQQRAFRWTQSTGMQQIGSLDGGLSEAYAVSDNGVIVGAATNAQNDWLAFRWTEESGMQDLNVVYADLLGDSQLIAAIDISPDGRYIVGAGYNAATGREEAFLLDTQPSCSSHNGDVDNNGCVDDADLLAVLFTFGQSGNNLGRVDVNCDHVADDADLLTVLFNFGQGC
jgi:probable HAF family extracellular repeat protein